MAVFGVSSEMTPKFMVIILGPTIWAIDFDWCGCDTGMKAW
jgi:hypothetical protein